MPEFIHKAREMLDYELRAYEVDLLPDDGDPADLTRRLIQAALLNFARPTFDYRTINDTGYGKFWGTTQCWAEKLVEEAGRLAAQIQPEDWMDH